MKQNLYLFKRKNNYKNKMYKSFANPSTANLTLNSVSFNPGDGVDAKQVVNCAEELFEYDYMVEEIYLSSIEVKYRQWFITDVVRKSQNQVEITLKRDIVGDYFQLIKNKDFYIMRGICDEQNSAIYNDEGFEFNQIKMGEELLKDRTESAWIVGYVPLGLSLPETMEFSTPDLNNATSISGINNLPYFSTDKKLYIVNSWCIQAFMHIAMDFGISLQQYLNVGGTRQNFEALGAVSAEINIIGTIQDRDRNEFKSYTYATFNQDADSYINEIFNTYKGNDSRKLLSKDALGIENGKLYYDTTQEKYYRVYINKVDETKEYGGDIKNSSLAQNVAQVITSSDYVNPWQFSVTNKIGDARIYLDVYSYTLVEEHPRGTYKIKGEQFTNDSVKVNKQPYKMFAFPVEQMYMEVSQSMESVTSTVLNDRKVIDSFLSFWTKDNARIIDLQLLPYCPVQDMIRTSENAKELYIGTNPTLDIYNNNETAIVARGVWVQEDSFKFIIDNNYNIENMKEEIACNMFRISSPHYESQFEFNAGKMNGWNGIKVECTYKPYQPYIHIMPQYVNGSLYGNMQYDDARGLVTIGSYSLPIASDEWATYQRTNSTYQLTFNRDMEKLEVENNLGIGKAIVGLSQKVGGGIATGALSGRTPGAIATGAGIGAVTGIAGIAMQLRSNAENVSYKKDMFTFTNKNIQAQPQTLTKVSALDINNRKFPVLEYYTCTETEKLNFKSFLYYNSYSINRFGKLVDYISEEQDYTYIEADFLRVENLTIDPHELGYLIECLQSGWYFKREE